MDQKLLTKEERKKVKKLCACGVQYIPYWPAGKKPIFKKKLKDFKDKKEYVDAKNHFFMNSLVACSNCFHEIRIKDYNEIFEIFERLRNHKKK